MANGRRYGGLELIVQDDNFINVSGVLINMFTHCHDRGEVVRRLDVAEADLEEIRERTLHCNSSFIADGEDFHLRTVALLIDIVATVPEDTRVDGAAKTSVRRDWHKKFSRISWHVRCPPLHVGIHFEHHVDTNEAILLSISKTLQVTAHLGSCHHLHGLRDLTDVANGFDTKREHLFTYSEVTLGERYKQGLLMLQKLSLMHSALAHSL